MNRSDFICRHYGASHFTLLAASSKAVLPATVLMCKHMSSVIQGTSDSVHGNRSSVIELIVTVDAKCWPCDSHDNAIYQTSFRSGTRCQMRVLNYTHFNTTFSCKTPTQHSKMYKCQAYKSNNMFDAKCFPPHTPVGWQVRARCHHMLGTASARIRGQKHNRCNAI